MKETIIQFGTGNFLRGFVDYFIDVLNKQGLYDGKIVIVQPTKGGKAQLINEQNGQYNLFLRGIKNGSEVNSHVLINSVSRAVDPYSDFKAYLALAENPAMRFIVSNTTEAGIAFDDSCSFADAPALSFPAKLVQLLYHRFSLGLPGFVLLPCELVDNNADELKSCVLKYAQLWQLGEEFFEWVLNENTFCNTLVDCIVTGYPADAKAVCEKIGYSDKLLNTAEPYHFWAIEGDFESELPLKKAGLNVAWVSDVSFYKKQKVRLLNGAHTALVFASLLCGVSTVRQSLGDSELSSYLNACVFECILPAIGQGEENTRFASAVLERFANPFIDHMWQSIALNSISKFSVRVLPTVLEYYAEHGELLQPLVFSLACLIEYYKTAAVQDDKTAAKFIRENSTAEILKNQTLWGTDLSAMQALVDECLARIKHDGIREAIKWATK